MSRFVARFSDSNRGFFDKAIYDSILPLAFTFWYQNIALDELYIGSSIYAFECLEMVEISLCQFWLAWVV